MTRPLLDTAAPSALRPLLGRRAGWGALAILTLINLLNYVDRFVVSALGESLRRSELRLTDTQFGFLASAFLIVYMASAPVFGALGDRGRRPPLIAAGVALWSLATALGGLAQRYGSLLAARATVGIGEAAYGAIAPALLADYFPERLRGRVFAVFFAATPIGAALGYVVGGIMDHRYGWRSAFFVAGFPGLLLALAALGLADPGRADRATPLPPRSAGEGRAPRAANARDALATYRALVRHRRYRLTVLGYAAYTFAVGGIAIWMPTFLERVRGLPPTRATVWFGAIAMVTGFAGTFAGGWIADLLAPRVRRAELWVCAVATLAAAPVAWLALAAARPPVYWTALVLAELLVFLSTSPVNAAIVGAVPADRRASAMALSIFAIHTLGDVPSPPLIGAVSDASTLARAVLLIPIAIAVGGVIWLAAARSDD